jgi:hypothetical protein
MGATTQIGCPLVEPAPYLPSVYRPRHFQRCLPSAKIGLPKSSLGRVKGLRDA